MVDSTGKAPWSPCRPAPGCLPDLPLKGRHSTRNIRQPHPKHQKLSTLNFDTKEQKSCDKLLLVVLIADGRFPAFSETRVRAPLGLHNAPWPINTNPPSRNYASYLVDQLLAELRVLKSDAYGTAVEQRPPRTPSNISNERPPAQSAPERRMHEARLAFQDVGMRIDCFSPQLRHFVSCNDWQPPPSIISIHDCCRPDALLHKPS